MAHLHSRDYLRPAKIVFISTCDPAALFLIKTVSKSYDISAVIRPNWRYGSKRSNLLSRIKDKLGKGLIKSALGRVDQYYRSAWLKSHNRWLSHQLFGGWPPPDFNLNTKDVSYRGVNSEEVKSLLRSIDPDFILVAGAPILKKDLFSLARVACLNIHYGITPHYRGDHTLFWPLKLRDYSKVGLTVHHIAEEVDRGPVVARFFPQITPTDNERSLHLKCCLMLADNISELLCRVQRNNNATGMIFNEPGQLIRYSDRKLIDGVLYRLRNEALPERPAAIERFWQT